MATYRGPVCRYCRRERMKLFLKGDRCNSDKCSLDRRRYPPGMHGDRRSKFSPYGMQLREKQKVKRMFGFFERQFRHFFHKAVRMKGVTGENLLLLLERRLDNMVFRMGFARTRREARQLVRHGHFTVNGKRIDVPSYLLKVGDVVQVKEKSRESPVFKAAIAAAEGRVVPSWLEVQPKEFKAVVNNLPHREDIDLPVQEHLIVELYSK